MIQRKVMIQSEDNPAHGRISRPPLSPAHPQICQPGFTRGSNPLQNLQFWEVEGIILLVLVFSGV